MSQHTGELFILSGPSGSGKTTLVRALLGGALGQAGRVAFAVSHTTRSPRTGESGADYHFVDRATFEGMVAEGRFLEWATVHGQLYGTSLAEVLDRLARGVDVILDIDVQGTERVLADHRGRPGSPLAGRLHTVFVLPPSFADVERRLRSRGLDQEEEITRRLDEARREVVQAPSYDYVIVNDHAERASEALAAIVLEKRHRQRRTADCVRDVLADFERAGKRA